MDEPVESCLNSFLIENRFLNISSFLFKTMIISESAYDTVLNKIYPLERIVAVTF
jgi:hypothetical protein